MAFVVDVSSRRILGWRVSARCGPSWSSTPSFRQALHNRHRGNPRWTSTGLVHHSDAESQYTSVAFTAELLEAGIAGSIGTVGGALDNALCESTIGLFETEAIDDGGPTWTDRSAVEWQVARWVHWYNTRRLHSSIGYLPPVEFERQQRRPRPPPPRRPPTREPSTNQPSDRSRAFHRTCGLSWLFTGREVCQKLPHEVADGFGQIGLGDLAGVPGHHATVRGDEHGGRKVDHTVGAGDPTVLIERKRIADPGGGGKL